MDVDTALAEFDNSQHIYVGLRDVTVQLLTRLLNANGVFPHSIIPRIKTRESLREKLSRDGKAYSNLNDVKDIVGIRVITYFEDELQKVDQIIKAEFEISAKDSYDRRSKMRIDEFGYRSIHYVCSYKKSRLEFQEYSFLESYFVEIQTRSILQHAWAEIEHEYYKSKGPKPSAIQRRNSRLAGLLELVDAEFIAIRKEMETYRQNINLRIDADEDLENVRLDTVSITSFMSQEAEVRRLDAQLQDALKVELRPEINEQNTPLALAAYEAAGVLTLQQLRNLLGRFGDQLLPFLRRWREWTNSQGRKPSQSYPIGISVYHLAIFLAALQEGALAKAFNQVNPKLLEDPFVRESLERLPNFASELAAN